MMAIITIDEIITEAVIDEVETDKVETEETEVSHRIRASVWSLLALRHSPLLAESKQHNETVLFTSRLDYRRFFKKKSGVFSDL
jgi:hypothetical protein